VPRLRVRLTLVGPRRVEEPVARRVRSEPRVAGRIELHLAELVFEVDRASPAVDAGARHRREPALPEVAVVVAPPLLHLEAAIARLETRRCHDRIARAQTAIEPTTNILVGADDVVQLRCSLWLARRSDIFHCIAPIDAFHVDTARVRVR